MTSVSNPGDAIKELLVEIFYPKEYSIFYNLMAVLLLLVGYYLFDSLVGFGSVGFIIALSYHVGHIIGRRQSGTKK